MLKQYDLQQYSLGPWGVCTKDTGFYFSSLQLLPCKIFFDGSFFPAVLFWPKHSPSTTPKPTSPALVIEVAGFCHWGDPIWRKPVSQGGNNWGSPGASGRRPMLRTLTSMETCTTFKLIFMIWKCFPFSKDLCPYWPESFLLASLNISCLNLNLIPL